MALIKKYTKDKKTCKVTFSLPKAEAKIAYLAGEFNKWQIHATPMKKEADGSFTVTLSLKAGREYQFRYLLEDKTWENDFKADKYVPSAFGACENSVVIV